MSHPYTLSDAADVFTPALVLYPDLIRQNIARVVEMAGGPDRLRPHVKTHKTREITRMQLAAGVTKHKCATIAEAEILADAGAPDVLLAYPLVGPNANRFAALAKKYPDTMFAALFDHPVSLAALAAAADDAGRPLGGLIDLNVGMDRSGIRIGDEAVSLYVTAANTPGVRVEGLHAYDGHTRHPDAAERTAAVRAILDTVVAMRAELERRGVPVPRIVAGGRRRSRATPASATCPASNVRRAHTCCTTRGTGRRSRTSAGSPRPRCWSLGSSAGRRRPG